MSRRWFPGAQQHRLQNCTTKRPRAEEATDERVSARAKGGMVNEFRYRISPAQCAVLVVDIQERMMRVIEGGEQVVRNAVLLLKAASIMGIPVIATTQYAAKIGPLLPEIMAELNGAEPLDKLEFGCFGNAAVTGAIRSLPREVNTLLVCGVETHICIYQTILDGLLAGYRLWVPADAVSSRAVLNHQTGLERIRQIGGVVANTEMIIYELLQKAGTDQFKAILPFIK
jgi:nicotinamidase-related amidase